MLQSKFPCPFGLRVPSALAQIEEQKYETGLIDRGIKNIKKLAVVFSGKDVYVKEKTGK